jgi:hypothetical protein
MKLKKFNNNLLYTYKDLCFALDQEVEQVKKQTAYLKDFFKKNPIKEGYSGRKLNEINWIVEMNGKLTRPIKRPGKDRAVFVKESFYHWLLMYQDVQNGKRYPTLKN